MHNISEDPFVEDLPGYGLIDDPQHDSVDHLLSDQPVGFAVLAFQVVSESMMAVWPANYERRTVEEVLPPVSKTIGSSTCCAKEILPIPSTPMAASTNHKFRQSWPHVSVKMEFFVGTAIPMHRDRASNLPRDTVQADD